ncbi:MAG: nitroreductase [Taibaiella sp.]|nr:nitroreductase [Taibaiella sp.]
MHNEAFTQVEKAIKNRRSTSWAKMNGNKIPDEIIAQLLELACWAPTHAKTEPWYFMVYRGEAMKHFAAAHAAMYWENTAEPKRTEAGRHKLEHNTDLASHLIVSVMKRGANEKIPVVEEIAAASAAIQNILLGATALGIASFWSTGGMTHQPALKQYFNLAEEDIMLGLIFLGYSNDTPKTSVRNKPQEEKIRWM